MLPALIFSCLVIESLMHSLIFDWSTRLDSESYPIHNWGKKHGKLNLTKWNNFDYSWNVLLFKILSCRPNFLCLALWFGHYSINLMTKRAICTIWMRTLFSLLKMIMRATQPLTRLPSLKLQPCKFTRSKAASD